MARTTIWTPDTGNKSAVVNTTDVKLMTSEKKVILKIHVYFDGTFGNKNNIDKMDEAIRDKAKAEKPDIHNYTNAKGDIDYDAYNKAMENYKKSVEKNKKEIKKEVDKAEDIAWNKTNKENVEIVISKLSSGIDPTKDTISYTQVYTNIPIMHDLEMLEDKVGEKIEEKTVKVYVEGVGTQNNERDDMVALATGSDNKGMGIPSKIKRAFQEIEDQVRKKKIAKDNITEVEVCVMGFSRGSATTRNFVSERATLLSTLKKLNDKIKDSMITYKFVGIFDTVCSVTDLDQAPKYSLNNDESYWETQTDYITNLQRNNIKDFKLAMGGNVKEVVHLTAADEFRLFFPLTNIQTSINAGCGYELVMPGSHCDLGGGDAALIPEKYEETVMNGEPNIIPKFLIDGGWFSRKGETPITKPNPAKNTYMSASSGSVLGGGVYVSPGYDVVGRAYKLTRTVTVGYNRIPLRIMLYFSEKLGEIKQDQTSLNDSIRVHKDLKPMGDEFFEYAKSHHGHKQDKGLIELFEKKYKNLKMKYTHISALEDGSFAIRLKNTARHAEDGGFCRAIFNDGDQGVGFFRYSGVVAARKAVDKLTEKLFGDD